MFSSSSSEKKNACHFQSVSIPFAHPPPGTTVQGHIPFGPPVVHLEPEKTLLPNGLPNTDTMNHHFFNISGPTIYNPNDFGEDDDLIAISKEDEKMEE